MLQYNRSETAMVLDLYTKGAFGRDSCAASESVFGEALPNALKKQLPTRISRHSRSLERKPGDGAEKYSFPRLRLTPAPTVTELPLQFGLMTSKMPPWPTDEHRR
jgi:hypothetical protein